MTLYSLHNYHNDKSQSSVRMLGCVVIAVSMVIMIVVICLVARAFYKGLVVNKSNTRSVSTIDSYVSYITDLTKEANREDTFEA